jgi:hypothetical protein
VLCEICKSDLPEGALFCGECGSSVRQSEQAASKAVQDIPPIRVAPIVPVPLLPDDIGLKRSDESSPDTQVVPRIEGFSAEVTAPYVVETPRFAQEIELESLVSFTITLGTGESVVLTTSALVGRMPQPSEGEQFEHLILIEDPGRSVSKTHLELRVEAGILWVSDRNSGNGSIVREPGVVPRRAQPGTRYEIVRGTRIDLGDQHLTIY